MEEPYLKSESKEYQIVCSLKDQRKPFDTEMLKILVESYNFDYGFNQREVDKKFPMMDHYVVNRDKELENPDGTKEMINLKDLFEDIYEYWHDMDNAPWIYRGDGGPEMSCCRNYSTRKTHYVKDVVVLCNILKEKNEKPLILPKDVIAVQTFKFQLRTILHIPIIENGECKGLLQLGTFDHVVCLNKLDLDFIRSICTR